MERALPSVSTPAVSVSTCLHYILVNTINVPCPLCYIRQNATLKLICDTRVPLFPQEEIVAYLGRDMSVVNKINGEVLERSKNRVTTSLGGFSLLK